MRVSAALFAVVAGLVTCYKVPAGAPDSGWVVIRLALGGLAAAMVYGTISALPSRLVPSRDAVQTRPSRRVSVPLLVWLITTGIITLIVTVSTTMFMAAGGDSGHSAGMSTIDIIDQGALPGILIGGTIGGIVGAVFAAMVWIVDRVVRRAG